MIEKNTVFLNLETYDYLKQEVEDYHLLKKNLENCLTKIDKKGNVVNHNFFMDNPIKKVKINLTELCKVLEIQDYKVEIINCDMKGSDNE